MSTLKADTIQSTSGGRATLTKQECCIAWWQYDQTNDTDTGGFNVSSISDDSTGIYTPTLTTGQPDVDDRAINVTSNHETGDSYCRNSGIRYDYAGSFTSTAITVETYYGPHTLTDNNYNFGTIFGGLS